MQQCEHTRSDFSKRNLLQTTLCFLPFHVNALLNLTSVSFSGVPISSFANMVERVQEKSELLIVKMCNYLIMCN